MVRRRSYFRWEQHLQKQKTISKSYINCRIMKLTEKLLALQKLSNKSAFSNWKTVDTMQQTISQLLSQPLLRACSQYQITGCFNQNDLISPISLYRPSICLKNYFFIVIFCNIRNHAFFTFIPVCWTNFPFFACELECFDESKELIWVSSDWSVRYWSMSNNSFFVNDIGCSKGFSLFFKETTIALCDRLIQVRDNWVID